MDDEPHAGAVTPGDEPPGAGLTSDDKAVVAGQLGRTPRDVTGVAVRCSFGYPAVIETAPFLAGDPNPTLLYLTCPNLAVRISRIEGGGGVRAFRDRYRSDPEFARFVDAVTELYRARRSALAGEDERMRRRSRLDAGIGGPGSTGNATCLHAHAAAFLAVREGWLGGSGPGPGVRPESGRTDQAAERAQPESDWAASAAAPGRLAALEGLAARASEALCGLLPGLDDLRCADCRCARFAGRRRLAVIDVGTISVRLLVADIKQSPGAEILEVERRIEITRLGEGLVPGGLLSVEAKARTARAVWRFIDQARRLAAPSVTIVGTSACRDAQDGPQFMESFASHPATPAGAGSPAIPPIVSSFVLTGEQEAALTYSGASSAADGRSVVLDVGGGSTEVICMASDGLLDSVSVDIGAGRATDRWVKHDPPLPEEVEQVRREAKLEFERLRPRFGARAVSAAPGGPPHASAGPPGDPADAGPPTTLIAVAGTVTTIACLDAGLKIYDRERVHLHELARDSVRRLVGELALMSVAERAALPCVQPGRAPVIVAGAAIALAAMESLDFDRLVVSEHDLLDGLMLWAADPTRAWR